MTASSRSLLTFCQLSSVLVLLGCSDSKSQSNDASNRAGNDDDTPCTIVWSSAVVAEETCTALSDLSYSESQDESGFAIGHTPPAGAFDEASLSVGIYFPGRPVVGRTYTSDDDGARGTISVAQSAKPWLATLADGNGTAGSYTLKITGVHEIGDSADGSAYTVHGTLQATLPARPNTDATGDVLVDVEF